jgi:NADH-quinone oxidoreductase subunit B
MTTEPSQPSTTSVPTILHQPLVLKPLNFVYNWGRMYSLWPLAFGLACCAIEMMATLAARFDLGRFGAELMRPSPRQADLLIVSGTVTKKMVSQVVRLYNQMPEPKYVIAMGACATAGGPFKEGYSVVSGVDKFLPVDVYVPGCPPTPPGTAGRLLEAPGLDQGPDDRPGPLVRPAGAQRGHTRADSGAGPH